MLMRDDMRNRWFRIAKPGNASRSGSAWFKVGRVADGKLVIRPITPQGWWALASFLMAWATATLTLWVVGYGHYGFTLEFAILGTVLVAMLILASLIRLVCVRMAALDAHHQSR